MLNVWIIYTLQLEDGCWYVGSTTTKAFKVRMNNHWLGTRKGAMWSRLHAPIKVHSIQTFDRSLTLSDITKLEDKRTLEVAAEYGYELVRGGGYCQMSPSWPVGAVTKKQNKKWDVAKARRELRASAKLCG